jgi:hypothetical protein
MLGFLRSAWRAVRRRQIVAVGSVNLDIFGDYEREGFGGRTVDRPGRITFAVGGSAYNVAANIARRRIGVRLISVLAENSLITGLVKKRIQAAGIRSGIIVHPRSGRAVGAHPGGGSGGESGFVAIRENGGVVSAVSSMAIDEVHFTEAKKVAKDVESYRSVRKLCRKVVGGIKRAEIVVIDANVSARSLHFASERVALYRHRQPGKLLFLSGVSEAKLKRAVDVLRDPVDLLCANAEEIIHALPPHASFPVPKLPDASTAIERRRAAAEEIAARLAADPLAYIQHVTGSLKAKCLIIACADQSALTTPGEVAIGWIVSADGWQEQITVNNPQGVADSPGRSLTGTADAALAATAVFASTLPTKPGFHKSLEDPQRRVGLRGEIREYATEILDVSYATHSGGLSFAQHEAVGGFVRRLTAVAAEVIHHLVASQLLIALVVIVVILGGLALTLPELLK